MSEIEKSNNDDNNHVDDEENAADESIRIKTILKNELRRAECGSVVTISKRDLLEPESYERMRGESIYGIISNAENLCPVTDSVAYQINWSIAHLPTGNSFFAFVAPVFEHVFTVVKYPDDNEDSDDDVEFTRQFKKQNGKWIIIEYGGLECEFCGCHICDRAQYRDELETMFEEVDAMGVPSNQKRYMMYRQFIHVKHGSLGNRVRRKLCDCVQELIVLHFPVAAGKRKRGFVAAEKHD